MSAKDYLKKIGLGAEDVIVNKHDLPEYWKTLSQLMEEYHQSELECKHEPQFQNHNNLTKIQTCEKCGAITN